LSYRFYRSVTMAIVILAYFPEGLLLKYKFYIRQY
jgi:hypothetical protein